MRQPGLWGAVAVCCAAVALFGCGNSSRIGSRYVKSVGVVASEGATITVDASEEPQLANTKLVIPPGALSDNTVITIEIGEQDITGGRAGAVAIFGPAGLTFKTPAELTLPYSLQKGQLDSTVFISVEEEDGRRFTVPHEQVTLDTAKKTVKFAVNGFTAFQPASGNTNSDGGVVSCNADSDCAAGDFCVNGACQTPYDGGSAPVCNVDSDCTSPGDRCFNGYCQSSPNGGNDGGVGSCVVDTDCNTPGDRCINGYCDPNWNSGPDAGFYACMSDSDCQPNEWCVNGACQTSWNAVDAGSAPDAGSNWACVSNNDCLQGEACVNGVCRAPPALDAGVAQCTTDFDCGAFGSCVNGVCQGGSGSADAGSASVDAGSTTASDGGNAFLTCNTSADCPPNQTCVGSGGGVAGRCM